MTTRTQVRRFIESLATATVSRPAPQVVLVEPKESENVAAPRTGAAGAVPHPL